jgi:hypothetical protein
VHESGTAVQEPSVPPESDVPGEDRKVNAKAGNGSLGKTTTSTQAKSKVPFWELIQSLGDKWATDDYKLYIYRKWPIIDKADSDHFIAKLREPIDPDYLLKTFGTGKYGLQLNDGEGKMVS